jgi:hypothetical protein
MVIIVGRQTFAPPDINLRETAKLRKILSGQSTMTCGGI